MNTHIGRLAVLAIAATALLAGCATSSPAAASHTAAAATPKATPTPAPVLGLSRQHPFPTGVPGTYDPTKWTVTFLSTDGNAWPTVQAFDTSNTPPPPGTTFVLATVKIVAGQASNPAYPSASNFDYVGSDGNTYPTTNGCGSLGDQDLSAGGQMYAGAMKTVLICAQVPTSAVSGGTWAVAEAYIDHTTPTVFFEGAS